MKRVRKIRTIGWLAVGAGALALVFPAGSAAAEEIESICSPARFGQTEDGRAERVASCPKPEEKEGETSIPVKDTGLEPIVFTTFIETEDEIRRAQVMVESLRTFGDRFKDAPVWVYVSEQFLAAESESLARFTYFAAEVRTGKAPENATWFYLARKVFAAAQAESAARGKAAVLARLDPDTIFIREPAEFILPEGKNLGYRSVFHRNISPLYDEPLDAYWSRAYKSMGIRETAVFPMITPADEDTIRPYFQAGCVVVRPEKGIMKKWEDMLVLLAEDPIIREISEREPRKRLFTFQVALTGAILNAVERDEMLEFSARINYPVFFREMFGAKKDFHDISDAVTVRYEHFFQNPPLDWERKLKGPADRIAWIKKRFSRQD